MVAYVDERELVAFRVRKRGSENVLLFSILGFIIAIITWAAIAELDEVVRGQGKVIPSQRAQEIQHLEGGIVQRVLVTEGEIVEKGQVLLELDSTIMRSHYLQARQQYSTLSARLQRLSVEVNEQPLTFPEDLKAETPAVIASETALYQGRRTEHLSEIRVLEQQLQQRRQELKEAQVNQNTLIKSIELLSREIALYKPLVQKGLEAEVTLIHLERSLTDMVGKREAMEIAIPRLAVAVREVEDRITTVRDKFRASALQELAQVVASREELEKSIPAMEDRFARTEVRSPVRGVVNRVLATTIGGIAQPGKPLVEVVPLDDSLLIQAYIKPADIAFLRPGQPVRVKLTAYHFIRYGSLEGKLETISASAVEQPGQNPGEGMYLVRCRSAPTARSWTPRENRLRSSPAWSPRSISSARSAPFWSM